MFDVDSDFNLPSAVLAASLAKWVLVYDERNATCLWLAKAAPRRRYAPPSTMAKTETRETALRSFSTYVGWGRLSSSSELSTYLPTYQPTPLGRPPAAQPTYLPTYLFSTILPRAINKTSRGYEPR
jgi:hypothetical protein